MNTHGNSDREDFDQLDSSTEQDWIQAAFEAHDQSSLIYDGELAELNLYHVTRLVATDTHCLKAHVRRIFLGIRCRNIPAIQGALVDLFIVLKGRGQLLFNRLLDIALMPFAQDIRGPVQQAFSSGDIHQVMKLPCGQSVLANGRSGVLFKF